jgi:hypothetical protein
VNGYVLVGMLLFALYVFMRWRQMRRRSIRREADSTETSLATIAGTPMWKGRRWPYKRRRRYQGVTAYVGLPGSGKTYSLAEVGRRALDDGREVWSNAGFDFAPGHPQSKVFSSFEEFTEIPNGAVVLWDELPLYVNSRKWQEFPDGLLYRLTQIRKDGLELHYSTIDWRMVDINVRRVTFWTWECRSITSRVFCRALFPPEERRKKDERARRREFVRVKIETAGLYDTYGKVSVAPPKALTAGEAAKWARPSPGEAATADQAQDPEFSHEFVRSMAESPRPVGTVRRSYTASIPQAEAVTP